jgi:hypothetical protein
MPDMLHRGPAFDCGEPLISIDAADAEGRYRVEPAHDLTPERIFERRWALTVLERALSGSSCSTR